VKCKLLASATTLEALTKSISAFYYGSTITLHPIDGAAWSVHNRNGIIGTVLVRLKGERYRFERLPDGTTISDKPALV